MGELSNMMDNLASLMNFSICKPMNATKTANRAIIYSNDSYFDIISNKNLLCSSRKMQNNVSADDFRRFKVASVSNFVQNKVGHSVTSA